MLAKLPALQVLLAVLASSAAHLPQLAWDMVRSGVTLADDVDFANPTSSDAGLHAAAIEASEGWPESSSDSQGRTMLIHDQSCQFDRPAHDETLLLPALALDCLTWKPNLKQEVYFFNATNEDAFTVFEAYSVLGGDLIVQDVGNWTRQNGFYSPKDWGIWDRRGNLRGTQIRAVYADNPPATFAIFDDERRVIDSDGHFPDILKVLQRKLNFTTSNFLSTNDKYGAVDEQGNWNGMVRAR